MFGTPDQPGLIPKCLERIFTNVGGKLDGKLLFKPDGLENLIATEDSQLDTEMHVRNYIFSDEKVVRFSSFWQRFSPFSHSSVPNSFTEYHSTSG